MSTAQTLSGTAWIRISVSILLDTKDPLNVRSDGRRPRPDAVLTIDGYFSGDLRCLARGRGEFFLHQLAALQPQYPVHPVRQIVIMRRDHRDEACLLDELQKLVKDAAGGFRVEIAGRLVGEQHERSVGDGAGDGDALLLAAGQLGRTVGQALVQAENRQEVGGALLGFGALERRR